MKVFFAFVLLYYFFGVQHFLQTMTGISATTMGWLNLIVITATALLYYHCRTHESSWKQIAHFFKKRYDRLRALTEKYLFVLALVLFVLATVAQVFRPVAGGYAGRFFAIWLLFLCIARDAFWDAKIYFGRHLFLHKESVFWFSAGLTFLVLYRGQAYMPRAALVAAIVGLFVYITIIKRANIVRGYNIRKLFPTKVYTLTIIILAGSIAAMYYNIGTQDAYNYTKTVISSYRDRTSQARDTITTPSQEQIDTIQTSEQTGPIIVVGLDEELVDETQTGAVDESVDEPVVSTEPPILIDQDPDAQVTFTDALTSIFASYDIALSTATNTRFTNIAASDPRYALFKTAHEKRLLGATINPDALVRCDVYLVMKGIVAGWEVSSQGNVFDQYRTAAQSNNAINGCTREGMLRVANL